MTADSSSRATPRHTTVTAYCCSVPRLTRFTGYRCARPDYQHHMPPPAIRKRHLNWGISLRCSGLRIQGTAASPVSTTYTIIHYHLKFINSFIKNLRAFFKIVSVVLHIPDVFFSFLAPPYRLHHQKITFRHLKFFISFVCHDDSSLDLLNLLYSKRCPKKQTLQTF